MVAIDPQARSLAGAAVVFQAASVGGDTVKIDDDRNELLIRNDGVGSVNVTAAVAKTVYGKTVPDTVLAVASGAVGRLPLIRDLYRDSSTGNADISYSGVTDVDVAVIR